MAGYYGYSMSNNAVSAYESGEKPLSKWTKSALLEAIAEIDEDKAELAKKLTASELKANFLEISSWHHTSKFYNRTDFYEISEDAVDDFNKERFQEIIESREPRKRRPQAVIDAEKAEKARKKAEKEAKAEQRRLFFEKEKLFKYQTKCKTLSGFISSKKVDLEELRAERIRRIAERREELRRQWESQGFSAGLEKIEDDVFVESYIH